MIDIVSTNQFEKFIQENEASLVYFSTPQCNVCKILKPKVKEFVNTNFPKIKMGYVNSEQLPDIAAQNRIFTVPTIMVFIGGKEFLRKSRNINFSDFFEELDRPYTLYFEE
jgi:thioredoxin-like negative regulator of GroEL